MWDNERMLFMNAIIIYYSRSGNTEKIAKQLQLDLGNIPSIKIEPEETYGNYIMSCFRVMKENRNKVVHKFTTPIPNLTEYDTIFIGFPIWAQDVPMFVQDFIRQCDTKGKTIIPFATYGMSGISWTKKTLNSLFDEQQIKLPFDSGTFKKGNYKKWLSEIKSTIKG